MSGAVLWAAIVQSAGIGIGTVLGVLIGMSVRKRQGKTEGLLAGSVVLTALAAGTLAMAVSVGIRIAGVV